MRKLLFIAAVFFLSGCSGVFFYPDRTLYATPQEIGIKYEERILDDGAGPKLYTWLLPAESSKGLIVYLHGNAENMSSHLAGVYWLPSMGYDLLLADYRGYGGSADSATLTGVNEDVARIIRYAKGVAATRHEPLILFGQSMGAALGLYAAALPEFSGIFKAVIAESPFSTYRAIARDKIAQNWITLILGYPFLYTFSNRFSPLPVVGQIKSGKLLFITGDQDLVVDPRHTTSLFERAPEPKELWQVTGAGHIQIFKDPTWRKKLVEFLDINVKK